MQNKDFSALMIKIASPQDILEWSKGEINSPDTINYRTWKPKEGGLFCEKTFWPVKNYECACWKHKGIRYRGITCDVCWVEVTTSRSRRERMGHIKLESPVLHVWYYNSTPSLIGLVLNLSAKEIEKIIYFDKYIVVDINEKQQKNIVKNIEQMYHNKMQLIESEYKKELKHLEEMDLSAEEFKRRKDSLESLRRENEEDLRKQYSDIKSKIKWLRLYSTISEIDYRNVFSYYEWAFKFKSWVEAIEYLLEKKFNLKEEIEKVKKEYKKAKWKQKEDLFKRLQLLINLYVAGVDPKWAILRYLPVIPADLRPIVQLDWWKIASSDINIFYRRVLMRNIRLKKMIAADMPDVIKKNEVRLLQESVNNLFIGERNNQWSAGAGVKVYKSLTDILIWKEWRFRKNLLWKRVDYSGRSVITVGPELKLDECWVPLYIAVKVFTPFIISRLLKLKYAYTPKQAEKLIKEEKPIALQVLQEVIKDKYVLLNRAPTLHRLGIQAFKIKLMSWKTIRIHPLVCTAFNADFDGDQMWLHLPLSEEAQEEAKTIIASDKNILRPGSGEPIITHTQDMVLWVYYLTNDEDIKTDEVKWIYNSIEDVVVALNSNEIKIKDRIKLNYNWEEIETTVGRVVFNSLLPEELRFINEKITKKWLKKLLDNIYETKWREETVKIADAIKNYWFRYATLAASTINVFDLQIPDIKRQLLEEWDKKVKQIHNAWYKWFLTDEEKHRSIISVWSDIKSQIESKIKEIYNAWNDIYVFIDSWARWDWSQLTQLSGMKWLVANPKWEVIELPIKSALVEWFSSIEYFIAAHGARKWKADTALKTAESWYLTRRLVDATQDMIIREEDCWTDRYLLITKDEVEARWENMFDVVYGRILSEDLKDKDWNVLLKKWEIIKKKHRHLIENSNIDYIKVRSPLTCNTEAGCCAHCYGMDLSTRQLIEVWTAIWVIASQSIWEPGTQLTMRTFHTWWVAQEQGDITQGIKRVEELFEVRTPKNSAVVAPFDWEVTITEEATYIKFTIKWEKEKKTYLTKDKDYKIIVKKWDFLKKWDNYAKKWRSLLKVVEDCEVIDVKKDKIVVSVINTFEKEIPSWFNIKVKNWEQVYKWQVLSWWVIDIREYRDIVGDLETQKYIISEVKKVYSSQWQELNEKYIEVIVKQLFSKVVIIEPWDSSFIPWNIVKYEEAERVNRQLIKEWKKEVKFERLILWLTQIAKQTDSWLSSASFQETKRVLVNASIKWSIDKLEDLKSNVIIGRKLPIWKIYQEKYYGRKKEEEEQD